MGAICKKYEIKDADVTEVRIEKSPKKNEIKFIEDFDCIEGIDKIDQDNKMSMLYFQLKNTSSHHHIESNYQNSVSGLSVITPSFSGFSSRLML